MHVPYPFSDQGYSVIETVFLEHILLIAKKVKAEVKTKKNLSLNPDLNLLRCDCYDYF